MKYDVQYFISFFEATSIGEWTTGEYHGISGSHCALGHCQPKYFGHSIDKMNKKSMALQKLFAQYHGFQVHFINDGFHNVYNQDNARDRILAALYDIRDKQLEEANIKAALELVNTIEEPNNLSFQKVLLNN